MKKYADMTDEEKRKILDASLRWQRKNREKANETHRRWREEHREQALEARRRYEAKPERKEARRQAYKIYRESHHEEIKEKARARYHANIEASREYRRERRRREREKRQKMLRAKFEAQLIAEHGYDLHTLEIELKLIGYYDRRAEIARERYFEGKTLQSIGDEHGITAERVRQICELMLHKVERVVKAKRGEQ